MNAHSILGVASLILFALGVFFSVKGLLNRDRFAPKRIQARILVVGTADHSAKLGGYYVTGWSFDRSNGAHLQEIAPNGEYYFCGYTVSELREIASRRSEWVDSGSTWRRIT